MWLSKLSVESWNRLPVISERNDLTFSTGSFYISSTLEIFSQYKGLSTRFALVISFELFGNYRESQYYFLGGVCVGEVNALHLRVWSLSAPLDWVFAYSKKIRSSIAPKIKH